jgi:integrase
MTPLLTSKLDDLKRHVHSKSHRLCCETFYMAGAYIPNDIMFPITSNRYPKSNVINEFKECAFIKYVLNDDFVKQNQKKRDLKSFYKLREEVFTQVDQYRIRTGRSSLKKDEKATKDLDIAFNFMKQTTRNTLKQSISKASKLNITQTCKNFRAISQENSARVSTRNTVHVIIDENHSADDPQGYVKSFEQHILNMKSFTRCSKSTLNKYLRSFKAIVKAVSELSPTLQDGISEYIKEKYEMNTRSSTLKNQLASVRFFTKQVAKANFDKAVPFEMPSSKRSADQHQPIFPTEYYQKDKFEELCQIFEKCEDLKYVAVLALFSGLRIFEIAKIRRDDFTLIAANKSNKSAKHYLLRVIGKGEKFRKAMIINENAIILFNEFLMNKPKDCYLFCNKTWNKAYSQGKLNNRHQIVCFAQTLGNILSKNISDLTLKKFKVRYPAHSMRRSFATSLYSINMPIDTISNIMGHSNTKTTKQYIDDVMLSRRTLQDLSKFMLGEDIKSLNSNKSKRKVKTKTTVVKTVEKVIYHK